jgi:hypothetical protein
MKQVKERGQKPRSFLLHRPVAARETRRQFQAKILWILHFGRVAAANDLRSE